MIAYRVIRENLDVINELNRDNVAVEIEEDGSVKYILFDRLTPPIIVSESEFNEKYEIDYVLSDLFYRYLVNEKR